MNNKLDKILAEISAGELIDKITILEIKKLKITNKDKLIDIEKELFSLNRTLNEFIPNETNIEEFKKELKKIKNQGYAFDDEEWFNGMVGISVPIFNSNKELCFCLSTHTAKSRKDLNDLKKILPNMLSSANNLKKALFKD